MLEELLVEARRGTRRQERTGLTFALLADEWFEHGKFERDWSAATQVDYRSVLDAHLIKAFGAKRVETITTAQIQKWRDAFAKELGTDGTPRRARHTVNKIVTQLHAVFEHAVDHHDLLVNPVAKVKRLRESHDPGRFDFFSPEEIDQLVAAAAAGRHRDPSRPAAEWSSQGVRVNAVAPGAVNTPLLQGVLQAIPTFEPLYNDSTPAGRFGTPEEIAEVVAFLASDAASYITGQVITADGGWGATKAFVPAA